jgi:hypothetical protein
VERKRFDLFVNEARDSSWANQAEETLERELSNSVPASTAVQNVECRTAVCRVATIHADLAAYTKYLLRLKDPDAPIWPADALTLETAYDHEQVLAISYFFREGPVP